MRKRAMSIGVGLAALAVGVGTWVLGPTTESSKLLSPQQAKTPDAQSGEAPDETESGARALAGHARADLRGAGIQRPGSGEASLEQVGDEGEGEGLQDAGGGPEGEPADGEAAARSVWSADKTGIEGAVKESFPDLLDCYQGWLSENPDIEGNVTVSFVIDAVDTGGMGGVAEVGVAASDMGHELMEGCVANVMAGLQFDAPEEPLTVNYPFEFTSAEDDEDAAEE